VAALTARGTLSADTKDALARELPQQLHCRVALAAALGFYGRKSVAHFNTQRASVARLFWALLEDRKARAIRRVQEERLRKQATYAIELPEQSRATPTKPVRRCDRVAELRGAFLACGSLSAGTRGYHLEFVLQSEEAARRLRSLLLSIRREPKSAVRKKRRVLY
jgi:DNA-binding transcriptional regulator WhiA